MREKIEALAKNEEFMAKLKACETTQAVCDLYATEGIEITPEDLDAAMESISANGGEIPADELDKVAGGCAVAVAAVCVLIIYVWNYSKTKTKKKK